ncbi:MAG: Nif3-like dinuclear metal center hexameric protein [Candidatus Buchananbacteria bacterium]
MDLKSVVNKLDIEFAIKDLPPDEPFSTLLPKKYGEAGILFNQYFTAEYLINFHGLMLKNSDQVNKIYLSVFLSPEILDKIFLRQTGEALIFIHHPMEFESSGRGFLPLPEKYFIEMQKRKISVYSIHTPLDIHGRISTSRSIAKLLELQSPQEYSRCSTGFAGIFGQLEDKMPFDEFIALLKIIFNLSKITYKQELPFVQKIGIIAGGGAEVEYMKETISLGCDTYLSGDYLNKVQTINSKHHRAEYEAIKDELKINLIECSHYATEKVVLENEMQDYFQNLGLLTEYIDQADYWK